MLLLAAPEAVIGGQAVQQQTRCSKWSLFRKFHKQKAGDSNVPPLASERGLERKRRKTFRARECPAIRLCAALQHRQ